MKVTEKHIQAALMYWIIGKQHPYIIPNSNTFFAWEADLLSIQRSGTVHEYEIKLNIHDFKEDAKKRKHLLMPSHASPAYFWYATYNFDIQPPEKAGWLYINENWDVEVMKKAPRLNNWKIDKRREEMIGRLLTYRLFNTYRKYIDNE